MAEPGGRHDGEHPDAAHDATTTSETPAGSSRWCEDPNRLHWARAFFVGTSLILGLVLLAVLAVLVLTGTDWGRERVRRVAQNGVNEHDSRPSADRADLGQSAHRHDAARRRDHRQRRQAIHRRGIVPRQLLDHLAAAQAHLGSNARSRFARSSCSITRRRENGTGSASFRATPRRSRRREQVKWGDWLRFTNATVIGGQLIVPLAVASEPRR